MMRCPTCHLALAVPSRPCPDCGVPVSARAGRLAPLRRAAGARLRGEGTVRVRRNGAALLDRPLPNARLVATLATGQPVRIRRVLDKFAEVETPLGHTGFLELARLEVPARPEREPSAVTVEVLARLARSGRSWLRAVPRALAWLQRSPRRAYTAAVAMTLFAILILAVDHSRDTRRQVVAPSTPAVVGDGHPEAALILAPADGATVAAPVRVTVQPPTVAGLTELWLAYFVDLDPTTVLTAGQPLPVGLPGLTVTADTTLTLDLAPGPHTVWVVPVDRDGLPLPGVTPARARFTVGGAPPSARAPLAYQTLVNGHWRLVTQGDEGLPRLLPGGSWDDVDPAWSPDGTRLAFASNREGTLRVYVAGAAGEQPLRVTDGPGQDRLPAWSPDGRWLLFVSDRDGWDQVYMVAAEGGAVRQLTHGPGGGSQPSWAPDGLHFAFVRLVDGRPRVFLGDTLGSTPRPLTPAPDRQVQPAWSPDGRFIAFAGLEGGRWSIYVAEVEGGAVRRVTSGGTDRRPAWMPDGRAIAFVSIRDGRSQIVAMDLERGEVRRLTDGHLPTLNPAWPRP